MATFKVEVTDTFAGEANYCWVHRHTITLPDGASNRAVVRAAKAAEGWTGLRCATDANGSFGDHIEVRPCGLLQVMFIDCEV